MVSLYIDNVPVQVVKNTTVLQACDTLGIDIPRFCFHERLLIAGNCRMCLVELEKSPKPVASCALPVAEGMKIFTKTPLVKKAQEGVLEFLLLNHPLDCPICDQGGECDLQDQAVLFGSDSSRFYDYKRGVEDKNCGPLVKTIMTRCIHCTRCVRFSSEIAGVQELGTLGRGTHTQIGTYLEKALSSELSGNVIDLCPVGALTSKPYAFKARSWELKSVSSIDISDSCGSNIVINSKGLEVLRVLPRLNEFINEEWISDKTRFSYDGLSVQRLGMPLVMNENLKNYNSLSWEKSFETFLLNIYKNLYNLDNNLSIVFGKDTDLETALTLKYFFNKLNCFSLYSNNNFCTDSSDIFYKFNHKIKDLSKNDLCILVNSNTRFEASMLNLHLRKNFNLGSLNVGYFGPSMDLTFDIKHLGLGSKGFFELLEGKHIFSKTLKKAQKPTFIFAANAFSNQELIFIQNTLQNVLGISSVSINILNLDGSVTGLRNIGIKSINSSFSKSNFFLYINTDLKDKQISSLLDNNNNFNVYCGAFGVKETGFSNLILPGKSFTEKKASFMNLEGLVQNTNRAVFGLGDAREEWKIFLAFFNYVSENSSYSKIFKSRFYNDFFSLHKFFSKEFLFPKGYVSSLNLNIKTKRSVFLHKFFYKSNILNFYKTNILSSLSSLMSKCSNNIERFNFK